MDVESIAPGTDFAEVIDAAVGSCTALVAVIGRSWSTAADGAAFVQPQVTDTPGRRSGLTFCPSRINGGKLPITGPFELTGQVLGPVGDRKDVLLVTSGDPRTCDALSNAPSRGAFLIDQADGVDRTAAGATRTTSATTRP